MIYQKWKGTILVLLAAALAVSLFYSQAGASGKIEKKVLRFHVIANSDREEDQELKWKVKGRIVEELKPLLSKAENLEESKAIVKNNLFRIQKAAEEVVKTQGSDQRVRAELVEAYFPAKSYGDCTFPAGNYEALRVTLGKAEGKNWWCVLFPGLCFVDTIHGVVPEDSKEELKGILTEEEYESLFQWDQSRVKISWKWFP